MNHEREQAKDRFLQQQGWGGAQRSLLAGDASFRRYDRVVRGSEMAVLMDAPPPMEDTRPFTRLARWLVEAGFSAPRILGEDAEAGFLLLEDLGDGTYTRCLRNGAEELALYTAATDTLLALHQSPAALPAIAAYDTAKLIEEACLLPDWYLRAMRGAAYAEAARADYVARWQALLDALPPLPPVLVLRDYHADNLMWLPERQDIARVGLLDFQDALIGSPAYDMVSFLEDARRDVAPTTVEACLAQYASQSKLDETAFRRHYALLGAQRNSKIIGIFTRLTLRDGKPQYLEYLPRMWRLIEANLAHPDLAPIAEWMERHLPAPYRATPPLAQLQQTFEAAA